MLSTTLQDSKDNELHGDKSTENNNKCRNMQESPSRVSLTGTRELIQSSL